MKSKLYINYLLLLGLIILFNSCDKGIEPFPETGSGETSFSGKVTFVGDWPDSIAQTHIIVFREPIQNDGDFFPPNLSFVIGPIPSGSTEFVYNSIDNNLIPTFTLAAGDYKYVVVAQSPKEELSLLRDDWVVAGIYYENNDESNPGILRISEGQTTTGINITCDFDNPPPQPPTIIE